MNTQKAVYKKLFTKKKTELETHKVELGRNVKSLFNDVDKLYSDMLKVNKLMEMALLDYRKEYNKYSTQNKEIMNKVNSLSAEKKQIETSIKELGINPKQVDGFFESGDMLVDIEYGIKAKDKFFTKPSI